MPGFSLAWLRRNSRLFLEEDEVDFFKIEIRCDHASTVVVGIGVLRQVRPVEQAGGRHGDAVAVDIGVEPIGRWTGHGAVELVEPAMNRRTSRRSRVVDMLDTLNTALADRLAVLVVEGHANVPLAEHGSGVSLLLQHAAERKPVRFDQARFADTGKHDA